MTAFARANYPAKTELTESEAMEVLANGPRTDWFKPWASRGVLLGNLTKHPFGYMHAYREDGEFNYDFAAWDTQEDLNWGLEHLWQRHASCVDCLGVVFFEPDQPVTLRAIIEPNDEGVTL